jgi:adenosylcobyric acid synthase
VARALGVDEDRLLDLSVSLNPFAPDLRGLLNAAVDRGAAARYPDEGPARAALASAIGVEPERLVLTNGGAEAIDVVARMVGRGSVQEPEFSLYSRSIPRLDPQGPRFRSNPHNPTGLLARPDETAAVWDEAFYALCTGRWTRADAGAVVVGSLTKLFGCPGLRIGYVICPDEELARSIDERRPLWSVNSLALHCIPGMLQSAQIADWARSVAAARRDLEGVVSHHGLTAHASDANWLLVEGQPDLRDLLAPRGVLVRDCASFGLAGVFRIAVPDARGLERLDTALAAALGAGSRASEERWVRSAPSRKRSRAAGFKELTGGLLVCGTGSDVGKSALVAGLCRLLARNGVSVAPFKAQNMALNSWVTDDGAEIGRAQGIQALASGIRAEAVMNPVLLKPTGERRSQVVVLGKAWATLDAAAYQSAKGELFAVILDSLARLRSRYDVVICEGAGSPAEINLLEHDVVNLRLGAEAGMRAVVVGDIDRGGVLASLYGTVRLVPEELRRTIRGFVVNKFRGDPDLLVPGLEELERRTGVPTLGVIPWIEGAGLDAEDSLALDTGLLKDSGAVDHAYRDSDIVSDIVDVAVVRFSRISNFTDLDALALEPSVRLRLVEHPRELGRPDLIVLPGTKTTVEDLAWMRRVGLADAVTALLRADDGPVLLGICGGYQMLGGSISDPHGVERRGRGADVVGLGLLPVRTCFEEQKTVRRRRGVLAAEQVASFAGSKVEGYEIHHGRVDGEGRTPWIRLDDAIGCAEKGAADEGAADFSLGVLGTSVHGLLESDTAREAILGLAASRRGKRFGGCGISFEGARQARLDRLADSIEEHVDLGALFRTIADARTVKAR